MMPLPFWAFFLITFWMMLIPYFTDGALKTIINQAPSVESRPAKVIALIVGLLWPSFLIVGIFQLLVAPRR